MSADYWELETVGRFEWESLPDVLEVTVGAEVPMSRSLGRLPRRGNRYWPTMVTVTLGHRDRNGEVMTDSMLPENARSFAAALLQAADLAEQTDAPDADECGHWWPCRCSHA